jgi:hypothetical protein
MPTASLVSSTSAIEAVLAQTQAVMQLLHFAAPALAKELSISK